MLKATGNHFPSSVDSSLFNPTLSSSPSTANLLPRLVAWVKLYSHVLRKKSRYCPDFHPHLPLRYRWGLPVRIDKYGVPSDIQWRGIESAHDRECKRCTVLGTGGKLRYLGVHCFGLTKVAKCWWEEDVEVCGDIDVPDNLHCWRCEVCGNEYTDDWFLS